MYDLPGNHVSEEQQPSSNRTQGHILEMFRNHMITDTIAVNEQSHMTSSLSLFVNAKPVESCFEKRVRLVQFLVELLSLNSTK